MTVSEIIRGFTSFWNDTIPFCDVLVEEINKYAAFDICEPLDSKVSSKRLALVNELGFELFCSSTVNTKHKSKVKPSLIAVKSIMNEVCHRFSRFGGVPVEAYSVVEINEAVEIAKRLANYFFMRNDLKTKVALAGCGWLSACEADAWSKPTLYEIKSGDQSFRGSDIRQLLVYCAANAESRQYEIDKVCLVNPRRGKSYEVDLNELCIRIAGTGSYEVIPAIVNLLTDLGTST
jgi:hypothetical protein